MSVWREAAMDAGYRGEEATQAAAMLERDAMEAAYARDLERNHAEALEHEYVAWLRFEYLEHLMTPGWAL